jgi:hypothetical protein
MTHSTPNRDFERRQTLRDTAADIAQQAGALLGDRTLSHDQRAALLALMETSWAAADALATAFTFTAEPAREVSIDA